MPSDDATPPMPGVVAPPPADNGKPNSPPQQSNPRRKARIEDDLPPQMAAGVGLTGRFLWILAGALVGFGALLVVQQLHRPHRDAHSMMRVSAAAWEERANVLRAAQQVRDQVARALTDDRHRPPPGLPVERTLSDLRAATRLDATADAALARCPEMLRGNPPAPDRAARLEACQVALTAAMRERTAELPDAETLRLLISLAETAQKAEAAERKDLLETAQLVLLNLLLPLLTAVLGYTFGTKEAAARKDGS